MITEPQQSPLYKEYMEKLHWNVIQIAHANLFIRSFPLLGGIAKLHRPHALPPVSDMIECIRSYHIRTLVVEPVEEQNQQTLNTWCQALAAHTHINTSPFLPTKTIRIDLTRDEQNIFSSFSEAKRRAVRRATKLGVTVSVSSDIRSLISIKNASAGLFGWMTTSGIKELWDIWAPQNASILLAHNSHHTCIGGVLLLHYDSMSYYWIAGSIKYGKKLFSPTLLVWEAIKESKNHRSKFFDFVGIWDERLPLENTQWKGFTKFKEGFGGKDIYYPLIPR